MADGEAGERFTDMYCAHHSQVFAYAVGQVGRQLADDVVGDTFLEDTSGEKLSDFELFRSGMGIVLNPTVRAEVRAAAFRMLADIDGVTSLGQVTDQLGRAGVAVGYARKGDGGHWVQPRLIIDPRTRQPLAQESWNLGPGKTAAATGELLGYTLTTSTRYTDDAPPIDSATAIEPARPRGTK